ncbi:hypothetical protein GCM10010532_079980 [Dactylosporangium siamense]|uniref:Uncharacterized protein n=1 Tax=Dactylosporangium siamense TaxID=685454 RepID=A0A919UB79_9ACTN|nr:hypothetical protein Dsi01nite_069080 [Dactylosporangium siamense]
MRAFLRHGGAVRNRHHSSAHSAGRQAKFAMVASLCTSPYQVPAEPAGSLRNTVSASRLVHHAPSSAFAGHPRRSPCLAMAMPDRTVARLPLSRARA